LVRNGPSAVLLDTKVVVGLAHNDSEPASLTPVGSPGVSADPVLLAGLRILTPADNRDDMVDLRVNVLRVDTTSVLVKVGSGINTAGDGTTSVDLLLHGGNTRDGTVLRGLVEVKLGDSNTVATVVSGPASLASGLASETVDGLIRRAGLIRDTVTLDIRVGLMMRSTITITSVLAVDEMLRSQLNLGPSVLANNGDTIVQSGSSTMSPAASTVHGDVLVTVQRAVVNS